METQILKTLKDLLITTTTAQKNCGMHDLLTIQDLLAPRPCSGPRQYRPLRQRARIYRVAGDKKSPPTRRIGEEEMEAAAKDENRSTEREDFLDRTTLCLPHLGKDIIVHVGDDGFQDVLRQYFPYAESNASERLVTLKARLRAASTHEFWGILMEEMCDIVGSQCGFVAKRMLVDDQDSAIEMPELGEPGSCLMGVAFYINNGADVKDMYRDYRYHAYGTPCAHMKHDKVFIVPERMTEFVRNNPNPMPWKKSEAFIGLPLTAEGKCFAHFGMMWSSEGASKRKLSWPFIEMFMHSLEDIILERILEGRGFVKEAAAPESTPAKVIPLSAITASQSLKPYARSLSHELRTPMQGVVGMLDIMYATVLDAIANQQSDRSRSVFEELKNHIEVVQDSSRRAVEAADNVVHAYDLNMQMPEVSSTPSETKMEGTQVASSTAPTVLPQTPITSVDSTPQLSPGSRKRARSEEIGFHPGPPLKRMFTMTEAEILQTYYPSEMTAIIDEAVSPGLKATAIASSDIGCPLEVDTCPCKDDVPSVGVSREPRRRIITRDFLRDLVNEALRNGHHTSETHKDTELGETIEFRTLGPRGEIHDRTISLEIESNVPEAIITEEQYLQFALQKLVDNAIKFTERGRITIKVRIGKNAHGVDISVADTGCGISEESKTNLFKPHFQQDASISRSRDGLGLSLFNAKAHVRKNLGGDVTLERSATHGPLRGSEFLIRLPTSIIDSGKTRSSLPGSPCSGFPDTRGASDSALGHKKASSNSMPIAVDSTPLSLRLPARKRPSFNPALAKAYPLNILIAEDNAINRNVAIGSLNKLGYKAEQITVAFDGLEAINHYKKSLDADPAAKFNCVLMDIWMPNCDGYEATTKIMELARQNGHDLKIIAVTADITEDSVERAKDAGMRGFLAKPYKVLDIEHLILKHFQS